MSLTVIRVLVLALIFAAIVLGIEGATSWYRSRFRTARTINKRLGMIAAGMERSTVVSSLRREDERALFDRNTLIGRAGLAVVSLIAMSGLTASARTILAGMMVTTAAVMMVSLLLAIANGFTLSPGLVLMVAAFAGAVGIALPLTILSRLAHRRRKIMEDQFPVALDTFVRGLRAGHPVASALDLLTKEMKDPIGSEFGIVVDEVAYGAELRDALQRMANRWDMNDIHMFVVSLSVQNETGGNLAEILENLSMVIRERHSLYLKVRALSSEGRMTGLILTALPVLSFAGLFLLNPSFYLEVAGEPAFIYGFAGLILLYLVGFFTIRNMINLKV